MNSIPRRAPSKALQAEKKYLANSLQETHLGHRAGSAIVNGQRIRFTKQADCQPGHESASWHGSFHSAQPGHWRLAAPSLLGF